MLNSIACLFLSSHFVGVCRSADFTNLKQLQIGWCVWPPQKKHQHNNLYVIQKRHIHNKRKPMTHKNQKRNILAHEYAYNIFIILCHRSQTAPHCLARMVHMQPANTNTTAYMYCMQNNTYSTNASQ